MLTTEQMEKLEKSFSKDMTRQFENAAKNALIMGEEIAKALGISVSQYRKNCAVELYLKFLKQEIESIKTYKNKKNIESRENSLNYLDKLTELLNSKTKK